MCVCVNQYVFVCVSKHCQQEFHNVFLVSMPLLTGILIVPIGHPIREYQNTYMAGTCVIRTLYGCCLHGSERWGTDQFEGILSILPVEYVGESVSEQNLCME